MGGPDGESSFVKPFLGLHHVTALAGDAQTNLDYYRNAAAMRLIKWTVNYDDPAQHHFYYADQAASLGSVLTFFPWGHTREARKGTGQAVAVAFIGAEDGPESRLGENLSSTSDLDGMKLELVAKKGPAHRIHSVSLSVADLESAETTLGDLLGLCRVAREGNRVRYAVGPDQYLDLLHEPNVEPGKMGAGIIHHLALRVGDEESLNAWRSRLVETGMRSAFAGGNLGYLLVLRTRLRDAVGLTTSAFSFQRPRRKRRSYVPVRLRMVTDAAPAASHS
jgi:glyoxalase family protein